MKNPHRNERSERRDELRAEQVHDAYAAAYPLDPGYEDRQPLYQLYYLLVHLNLFGESYGPRVDDILRQYVG